MAMTNAERQAQYRARKREENGPSDVGNARLNLWVDAAASFALQRLARYHRHTQRVMLQRLIVEADDALMKALDEEQLNEYLAGDLRETDVTAYLSRDRGKVTA